MAGPYIQELRLAPHFPILIILSVQIFYFILSDADVLPFAEPPAYMPAYDN